eukprot:TRINITY_DN266_c0_g1_i2.p1 TRINITY_DN266_c0_g1~~TRINITY_DN266_c0_g1_i2.p1  ORF type:complete len:148 (+),score=28.98 TRINITY_DN266_c0_g1_i2:166-609(+)
MVSSMSVFRMAVNGYGQPSLAMRRNSLPPVFLSLNKMSGKKPGTVCSTGFENDRSDSGESWQENIVRRLAEQQEQLAEQVRKSEAIFAEQLKESQAIFAEQLKESQALMQQLTIEGVKLRLDLKKYIGSEDDESKGEKEGNDEDVIE